MADAVTAPRKKKVPRVERRGRFTITEIEPDSPASSTMGEPPTFRTHAEMQDGHISEEDEDGDDAHDESGEDGDIEGGDDDDDFAGSERPSLVRESASEAAVLLSTSTSERISPFGSAVFEHNNSARVVDASGDSGGAALNAATAETAAVNGERPVDDWDGDGNEGRRTRSPTIDETSSQDNRRVKQKGRFTIIELSSDSPRSRKNSAEEFSNTTSISVTSAQVSQANHANAQSQNQSLGTSPNTSGVFYGHNPMDMNGGTTASAVFARMVSENNSVDSTCSSRSMVEASRRGRENDSRRANLSGRRSSGRLHSVSPLRERTHSDRFSHHELGSSYGGTTSTTSVRGQSYDPLYVNTSPQFRPAHSPTNGMSSMSLSSSYSSSMAGTTPTGNSASRQIGPELGANRRHLASRQKAITISAEQFVRQQHTIASLIRQQQELKQLIGVLAEQQQHLVAMPKELADFRLDQAYSDSHEDSMREVQLQVGALSNANEALQQLLSEAEQDASERTMEIECLSNENNEIRYRFSNLERRYHEEKKRSLTLEQELQRTRRALYVARHKDKGDLQKYQQKLSNRASSREMEDPVETPTSPAKVLV